MKQAVPEQVYDIVVVGAGPAGYTAAMYTSRAGLKTLLVEGASSVSQITVTDMIENYPGVVEGINGFDLVERFKKQAELFGAVSVTGDVTGIARTAWGEIGGWTVSLNDKVYEALAVIVATGASWRRLGVPGEESLIGKGVSFCATCDGPFYRNRAVAVIGGGNAAIQEAIFLTNFAEKVMVIHRRDRLRASAVLQKRALANAKIEFVWDSVVEEILGENGVEGLAVRNVKNGSRKRLSVEGVFIFIGLNPNVDLIRNHVTLAPDGAIEVDREMRTSAAGIFACGDCTHKALRQVITACGDGATAAYAAQLYVEELKGEAY
jgi:thioredoxin reductase (NADPH)